jgi:hypothetical protein
MVFAARANTIVPYRFLDSQEHYCSYRSGPAQHEDIDIVIGFRKAIILSASNNKTLDGDK